MNENVRGVEVAVNKPGRMKGRYLSGKSVQHLLLPPPDRPAAAVRLLGRERDLTDAQRAEMAEAALGVLGDARFAEVFGAGGRAEVAIAGSAEALPPGLRISGRIDRLVVLDDRVTVAANCVLENTTVGAGTELLPFTHTVVSQSTASKWRSTRLPFQAAGTSNVRRYQRRCFSSTLFITPESADSTGKGTRILPSQAVGWAASFAAIA